MMRIKRKVYTFLAIAWSFIPMSTQSAAVQAPAPCAYALKKLMKWPVRISEAEWKNTYEKSKAEGDLVTGTLALSQILLHHTEELAITKPEVKAIQVLAERIKHKAKLNPEARKVDQQYKWMKEILWAIGPFLFRPFLGLAPSKLENSLVDISIALSNPHLRALGIEKDKFLEDIQYSIFKSTLHLRTNIRRANFASFARSSGLALLLGIANLSPLDAWQTLEVNRAMQVMDNAESPMQFFEYLDTVKTRANKLSKTNRVAFLVDEAMITAVLNGFPSDQFRETNPTKGIGEISTLARNIPGLKTENFKTAEELSQLIEKYSDMDAIIIMAHGTASEFNPLGGDLSIDGQLLSSQVQQFKKGILTNDTALIFISCNFGSKIYREIPEKSEVWVQLTDHLANNAGVRAFAALNTVSFSTEMRSDLSPLERAEYEQLIVSEYILQRLTQEIVKDIERANSGPSIAKLFAGFFLVRGTGLTVLGNLYLHSANKKFTDFAREKGLRVYSVSTGKTDFVPATKDFLREEIVLTPIQLNFTLPFEEAPARDVPLE